MLAVCVCVCVCVCVTHTHTHMYIHMHTHIRLLTYIHMSIYTHIYVYIYLYIHVYMYVCVYVCVCVWVWGGGGGGGVETGGALFVFTNKRHTRLKVLYFDGSGLWLLTKRLEQGTFAWPKAEEIGVAKLALRPEALAMLTDGVDLRGAKLRPWFARE
jgi:hypothetical protein